MSGPGGLSLRPDAQARRLGLPVKSLDWAMAALHDGAIPSNPTAPRAAPCRARVCSPATPQTPGPLGPDAPATAHVGSPSAPRPAMPVTAAEAALKAHPGLGRGSAAPAEAQGAVADAALAKDLAAAKGCAAQQQEAGPTGDELIEDSQSYDVSQDEEYGPLSPVSVSMGPRSPPGRSLWIADMMYACIACCICWLWHSFFHMQSMTASHLQPHLCNDTFVKILKLCMPGFNRSELIACRRSA